MSDQLLSRINLFSKFIDFGSWNQHFRLDFHQGCCKQDKLTGHFYLHFFQMMEVIQEVLGYLKDGNIINIQLISFDKEEHQIEWSLEKW